LADILFLGRDHTGFFWQAEFEHSSVQATDFLFDTLLPLLVFSAPDTMPFFSASNDLVRSRC
jgi:hypothetical protein